MVCRENVVNPDSQDNLELQEILDHQDPGVRLDNLDLMVLQENEDPLVAQAQMDNTENRDLRESKDHQVFRDPLASREIPELPEVMVTLAAQDH